MCGRLIALVQPFTKRSRPPLWTYVSAQGSRWTYTANPNAKLTC